MDERRFDDVPRVGNAFTDSPRRYRSEARSERGSRINRLFGGSEAPPMPASLDARGGGTVIYSPSTYEDVQMLIDHLKLREQVIVDFSSLNQAAVFRILDFMSGAIYALNGSIQKITTNIFLFAPSGVTISVPPSLGRK